jgi:hypothetical protein
MGDELAGSGRPPILTKVPTRVEDQRDLRRSPFATSESE